MVTDTRIERAETAESAAWRVARTVTDPELPMLTLADLGVLRDVSVTGETVTVTITPTYSGCPALTEMRADLHRELSGAGYRHVEVHIALSPPWSSDWISEHGRRKLAENGISPPGQAHAGGDGPVPLTLQPPRRAVRCPNCGSDGTEEVSAFSATACKALYRCVHCLEPFEHFKEI